LVASIGKAGAAKALGISASRLRTLLSGKACADRSTAQLVAARLPDALQGCEKLSKDRREELQRLNGLVQLRGLRETARQLGVDPSNLRRRLLEGR
jgi:hypothetical protein